MMNHNYPEYILKVLREREGMEEDDTSMDETFQDYNPDEVIRHMLEWEGICGYTSTILGWIADIYGIKLTGDYNCVCDKSDKAKFVKGFGNFMRYNTGGRTEIIGMEMFDKERELVNVIYRGGHGRTVSVDGDSEIAVIRDIMKKEG